MIDEKKLRVVVKDEMQSFLSLFIEKQNLHDQLENELQERLCNVNRNYHFWCWANFIAGAIVGVVVGHFFVK